MLCQSDGCCHQHSEGAVHHAGRSATGFRCLGQKKYRVQKATRRPQAGPIAIRPPCSIHHCDCAEDKQRRHSGCRRPLERLGDANGDARGRHYPLAPAASDVVLLGAAHNLDRVLCGAGRGPLLGFGVVKHIGHRIAVMHLGRIDELVDSDHAARSRALAKARAGAVRQHLPRSRHRPFCGKLIARHGMGGWPAVAAKLSDDDDLRPASLRSSRGWTECLANQCRQ